MDKQVKVILKIHKSRIILMIIKLKVVVLLKMRYGSENIYLELVSTSSTI